MLDVDVGGVCARACVNAKATDNCVQTALTEKIICAKLNYYWLCFYFKNATSTSLSAFLGEQLNNEFESDGFLCAHGREEAAADIQTFALGSYAFSQEKCACSFN